jgi:asparagine synthase (glutamine-hydrolysing)
MCGILGAVGFPRELSGALNSMVYRGPDDFGEMMDRDAQVYLGHRRLSILDLSAAGHQPMGLSSSQLYIVFNGEVYNFRELRDEHFRHAAFNSGTDTEVILQAYQSFGHGCPELLRGMFAFGIYDKNKGELFLSRDRLGIKPLYYYEKDGRFAFSSELAALKLLPDVDLEIDPIGLDYYFTYGYIPAPHSAYKYIKKLKAAHVLIYDVRRRAIRKIRPYWRLKDSVRPRLYRSEDEWIEAISHKVQEAIRLHLVSDVPLGAFLSGGLDSSLVVSTMSGLIDQPVKTFTMGFEFQDYDERVYAESVAKQYGTDHHVEVVNPDAAGILPQLIRSFGEPFYDASAIPTYFVSRMARKHVTVALSGDGGDEVFAGYGVYGRMYRYLRLHRIPLLARKGIQRIGALLPRHLPGYGFMQRQVHERIRLFHEMQCCFPHYERERLYTEEFKRQISKSEIDFYEEILAEQKGSEDELITDLQLLDLNSFLPDDVLTKVDRMSMLHSLETRVPLLDHELVELAFSCPATVRFRAHNLKHVVKRLLSGRVAHEVLDHKKQGFAVPLVHWFRSEWKGLMDGLVNEARNDPWLDGDYVKELLGLHQKGGRDFSKYLYAVLFYKLWLKDGT